MNEIQSDLDKLLKDLPLPSSSSSFNFNNPVNEVESVSANKNISGFITASSFSLEKINETQNSDTTAQMLKRNELSVFSINLHANATLINTLQTIKGHVKFKPSGIWGITGYSQEKHMYRTRGLYFSESELLVLVASKSDFVPLEMVALMTPRSHFDQAKNFSLVMIDQEIESLRTLIRRDPEGLVQGQFANDQCSIGVFLRLKQGHEAIHTLNASALMYSKDCGFAVKQLDGVTGLELDYYWTKHKHFAMFLALLLFANTWLFSSQMEYTSSQSALSRVSPWTIGMHVVMDAYICLTTFTCSVVFSTVFAPYVICAFLSFVAFSIFEMRYQLSILQLGQTEESSASKYSFFLFLSFLIVYQASIKNSIVAVVVLCLLYSSWIPQIISNIKRNTRKAFTKKYFYGSTILRLLLLAYILACPSNIINYGESYYTLYAALFIFTIVQVSILTLHDWFGPRLLLPSSWFSEIYNYHPIINENQDEESSSLHQFSDKDCAICFAPVDLGTSSINLSTRLNYMVTPCHHLFHSDCLERWMDVKLECPVCRSDLPPIY